MSIVYFAQAGAAGPIKIGTTAGDVDERITDLQIGCPWKIKVMGWIEGQSRHEGWMHRRFAHCRLEGEWFEPTANLLAAIAEIIRPGFVWPEAEIPAAKVRPSKLLEYMRREGMDDAAFAALIGDGCTARAVKKWKYGERRPPGPRIIRIEQVTHGQVTLRDLFEAQPEAAS